MKIRNGFVSNSSSSSFTAAASSDVVEFVIKMKLDQLGTVCTTVKELDRTMIEEHGWKQMTIEELLQEEDWLTETYYKAVQAIKDGKKVVLGTISNDDWNGWSYYFYQSGIPPAEGFEVLDVSD